MTDDDFYGSPPGDPGGDLCNDLGALVAAMLRAGYSPPRIDAEFGCALEDAESAAESVAAWQARKDAR